MQAGACAAAPVGGSSGEAAPGGRGHPVPSRVPGGACHLLRPGEGCRAWGPCWGARCGAPGPVGAGAPSPSYSALGPVGPVIVAGARPRLFRPAVGGETGGWF